MRIQTKLPQRSWAGDLVHEWRLERRYRRDAKKGYPLLLRIAEKRLGYRPDIHNPKTFNEKVQWRKVYDQNPLFPIISDKLRLRDYLAEQLGNATAANILPELLLVTDTPQTVDLSELPDAWVAKANHASGWNIFATPDDPMDEAALRHEMTRWLRLSYGKKKREWAYQSIPRKIMFEGFMEGSDGRAPDDLKFVMFGDSVGYVMWEDDRFGNHSQHLVDEHWTPLDFTTNEYAQRDLPPPPDGYAEMLSIAKAIGKAFDHVRVDFMFTKDGFVLNELTLYRGSGMKAFNPVSYDRLFGDMWTLPTI